MPITVAFPDARLVGGRAPQPRQRLGLLAGLLLLLIPACTAIEAPSVPGREALPSPVRGSVHMVAAAHPLAAHAGRQILREGGSALDAAIATAMVLTLVEPQHSGIGGGGFLLHYNAATNRIDAYDGRETAPAAATAAMFLDASGKPKPFFDAAVGGLAVGVPGLLRMLELAHRDHGRLPWARLFEPAIELAEAGFEVSPKLARMIAEDEHLRTMPSAYSYFYHEDGTPLAAGEPLRNPELAAVLRRLAYEGADGFYRGEIARDIVRAVRTVNRNPGALSETDLAGYVARRREPVCRPYRVWRICGAPPPSAGGIATLQIMALLEPFDIAAAPPSSVDTVHRFAEASRLAFADRDAYVADPDRVPVPTAGLLDTDYLSARSRLIGEVAAPQASPGLPPGLTLRATLPASAADQGISTSHLSIVDANGNAVALTASIEHSFGSRLMVRGFLLNNQLTDFAFTPAEDGVPVANRAGPGKRPRSSMAPTIVFDAADEPILVIGSPGGSRIIDYVAQSVIGVLDWGLDVQAAIDLPHVVNRNGPTELEKETSLVLLKPALEAKAHDVVVSTLESGLNGVHITPQALFGGADRRREGAALAD